MARISVRLDYLEQHLFDGKAHIDAVAGVNVRDRMIDLHISGEHVPDSPRVVEVVTEKAVLMLPLVRRVITFEPDEIEAQLDLAMPLDEPTISMSESRYELFKRGLMAVEQLIACSGGVTGLETGDPRQLTDWRELRPSGNHPGWLKDFYRALDLIEQE